MPHHDSQRPPRAGQLTYLSEADKQAIYDAALCLLYTSDAADE